MTSKGYLKGLCSCLSLAVIAVAMIAVLGCDDEGIAALSVTPTYTELDGGSTNLAVAITVGGTVSDLALPLEWSLSNGSLGSIVGASGVTATYVRFPNTPGVQEVTVKDQFGSIGRSTVVQQ